MSGLMHMVYPTARLLVQRRETVEIDLDAIYGAYA